MRIKILPNILLPLPRSCCGEQESWNVSACVPLLEYSSFKDIFPNSGSSLDLAMIDFSSWNVECPAGTETTQLYPGWSCYDRGFLQQDGDIFFLDRQVLLPYGEFCLARLDASFMRGNQFVQACLPSKKKRTLLPFYSYILGISIISLFCTMVIGHLHHSNSLHCLLGTGLHTKARDS